MHNCQLYCAVIFLLYTNPVALCVRVTSDPMYSFDLSFLPPSVVTIGTGDSELVTVIVADNILNSF